VSFAEHVGEAVQAVADDVRSVVIADTGHFVAEQSPDDVLAALTRFLATNSERAPTAHHNGSHAVTA
jgi:pimeloyl-ACP methyl ester carboxylesterase